MHARHRLSALLVAVLVAACNSSTGPSSPAGQRSAAAAGGSAVASMTPATSAPPSAPIAPGGPSVGPPATPSVGPSPSPSVLPSVGPSAAPSSPPGFVAHDPRKFGFAAKGMTNEMMAFVTTPQLEYAVETMDWDTVSTVAFFSLEATRDGKIARDGGWKAWNSARTDRLIETAHRHGTKVVMSLERFAWSRGQIAITRQLLSSRARRDALAREVAQEVVRRGVDGVNVDFEPIPAGQREEFTAFMKTLRRELDRVQPGLQLTFCVVGHHESYDVAGATGPDAADAGYRMGYHYAGTWSKRAGSTSPMGGPQHDVVDSVRSLLKHVERHELIVGLPYYGHAWPTAGSRLNAATQGGGFDVTLDRAIKLAARFDARYDKVQQVAWVPYRARPCDGCAVRWYQLYFDDARALEYKLAWIRRNKLLGTGVWTIGFEGGLGPHAAAMRAALLVDPDS